MLQLTGMNQGTTNQHVSQNMKMYVVHQILLIFRYTTFHKHVLTQTLHSYVTVKHAETKKGFLQTGTRLDALCCTEISLYTVALKIPFNVSKETKVA